MIFGLAVTSIITGRIVSNLGRYKWPMIWGFTMTGFGMLLLSFLNADSAYFYEVFIMAVMGIGMGASMPIINLAIQNEFPQHEQGVASSMSQLFRGLGSTIGTAVLGSILAAELTLSLGNIRQDPYVEMLAKSLSSSELFKNFDSNTALQLNNPAIKEKASSGFNSSITKLPEVAQASAQTSFTTAQQTFSARVVEAFVKSLHSVFVYSALVMFLATVLAFFVKEKQLKGIKAEASEGMI
jgi:MFS family permease